MGPWRIHPGPLVAAIHAGSEVIFVNLREVGGSADYMQKRTLGKAADSVRRISRVMLMAPFFFAGFLAGKTSSRFEIFSYLSGECLIVVAYTLTSHSTCAAIMQGRETGYGELGKRINDMQVLFLDSHTYLLSQKMAVWLRQCSTLTNALYRTFSDVIVP